MTGTDVSSELQSLPADVVSPVSEEELAEVLADATARQVSVSIWGGGTHRDVGNAVDPALVVSTAAMTGIEDWRPDDLTVVARAGTPVEDLEAELAGGGQSAVLPEQPGGATVGGVVSTAMSPYARLRYGPTRDRVLEVRAVTGDGRIVKGGGRVVKNVSGYDLPRLYTGSLGSLGVITSVCFKLWPVTKDSRTVRLDEVPPDPPYRPRAVLETRHDVRVLLSGTSSEVEAQAWSLGGESRPGFHYPAPVEGTCVWSLRIRPKLLADAVAQIPAASPFVAQHGVGEVTFGVDDDAPALALRGWAEARGGAVVRLRGQSGLDPWGTPPPALDLQRRVIAAFDPARILEPGRLPGGL